MDQEPLVEEQIEAGSRFLVKFDTYAPVKAAFWLKTSEIGRWYLYVASDRIDDKNFDLAYGEVLRIAREMNDPKIDAFHVKIVRTNDPLVAGVLAIQQQYPCPLPTVYRRPYLGGESIEEAYIYPLPASTTTTPYPTAIVS